MFFYISGMGATFFNTEAKGFAVFLGDKILRLIVPFILAIFIFLIPRLYFGQQYEDFTRPNGRIETDYWEFQMQTLPTIFSKLSWLWYLPALFIDCILTYPLLAWSVRRAKKIPFNGRDDGNIVLLQLAILIVWSYPCFYMDTDDNYGQRFLLPSILTLAIFLMIFYSFQMLIHQEGGAKYAMWMKLIGPIGSVCLNLWKDQAPNRPLHHVLMMINYDAIFFSQGLVDQLYFKQMLRTRNYLADTIAAPIAMLAFILLYSLSSPQNYSDTGFLFFYPLYGDWSVQCLYTSGTWMWVFVVTWLMHAFANKEFNATSYKLLTGSSLYAYISHYFFIIIIAVMIIRPYKITFLPALVLEIVLTNATIIVSYIILDFVYGMFVTPKQPTRQRDEEEQQALLKNEEIMVNAKN